MRELFAVELQGSTPGDNERAWPVVADWAEPRPEAERIDEPAPSGGRALTLHHPDEQDAGLWWRVNVTVGPPAEALHAIVRVRLEPVGGAAVAPVRYEFGAPRVVRTLLSECEASDAGVRLSAAAVEMGHSDCEGLVELLLSPERRLPVVVVSRTPDTGETLVDARRLAWELAGIAHVRVLASSHAAWRLTDAVGASRSVWDGGVRVYFPGFDTGGDPYPHRLYVPGRVDDGLVGRLLTWLASLSSARTPEHPVRAELREERNRRLAEAGDADEQAEMADLLATELNERKNEVGDLHQQVAHLRSENETLHENLAQMSQEWGQRQAQMEEREPAAALQTVAEAVAAIEELAETSWYARRVTVTDAARKNARAFASYNQPAEMLRAVQAVMEAGAQIAEQGLGEPPADFFARRGFGYGSQPEPHLKVDESTSPDQCLRIYWHEDPDSGHWTITHIGSHK